MAAPVLDATTSDCSLEAVVGRGTMVLDIEAEEVLYLAVPCLDLACSHFYFKLEFTAENDWLKFLAPVVALPGWLPLPAAAAPVGLF